MRRAYPIAISLVWAPMLFRSTVAANREHQRQGIRCDEAQGTSAIRRLRHEVRHSVRLRAAYYLLLTISPSTARSRHRLQCVRWPPPEMVANLRATIVTASSRRTISGQRRSMTASVFCTSLSKEIWEPESSLLSASRPAGVHHGLPNSFGRLTGRRPTPPPSPRSRKPQADRRGPSHPRTISMLRSVSGGF